MDYKVRIAVGRYRRARDFLSDLATLRAFRGEHVGPTLLENLEELGLLRPRVRLSWPDAIARRIWLETHDCRYVRTLGTLPVNSLIWDGGSIHDKRRTRHST